jgi:hypothetical protein
MGNFRNKIIVGGFGFMPDADDLDHIIKNMVISRLFRDSGNTNIETMSPFHAFSETNALNLMSDNEPVGFGLNKEEYSYEFIEINNKKYFLAMENQ